MDVITLLLYMAYNTNIVRKKDTKQLTYMIMSYSKHNGRDRAPTYTPIQNLGLHTPKLQISGSSWIQELSGPESHELSSAQAAALFGAPFQDKKPVSSPCLSTSDPGNHTR